MLMFMSFCIQQQARQIKMFIFLIKTHCVMMMKNVIVEKNHFFSGLFEKNE